MKYHRIFLSVAMGLCSLWAACAVAQTAQPSLNAAMREEIVMVPKGQGLLSTQLETTIYRPPGAGPFPVVVINHGKSPGNTRFQPRYRAPVAAKAFLERGYLVVLPMRQGFAKSTGSYVGGGCNIESNGRVQAEDVQAVLDYIRQLPDADASRMVVVGQSHGGLTTMALGTLDLPGVRGLINFAGGLRQDSCVDWQGALVGAFARYGAKAHLPSVWFYGDNDSFFSPDLFREMHARFIAAGGKAQLVAYGTFESDSHQLFGSARGLPIWLPTVARFLDSVGLPSQPVLQVAALAHNSPVPPAQSIVLDDVDAVPFVRDTGREGYRKFLAASWPRAFALAPSGSWAYMQDRADAMAAAVARCNEIAKSTQCRLYAVDDAVVWTAP